MISSSDRSAAALPAPDDGLGDRHGPHRSRARTIRLVAMVALGLVAIVGPTVASTSSVLTDLDTVTIGVTTAPSFPPTATATPTTPVPSSTP